MDLSVVKPEGQTFSGPRTIDPDPNPPTDSAGKDAVRPSPVNLAALFLPCSLLLPPSSGFSADLLSPITVSEPISSFEMDERASEGGEVSGMAEVVSMLHRRLSQLAALSGAGGDE